MNNVDKARGVLLIVEIKVKMSLRDKVEMSPKQYGKIIRNNN